jgi:hypothetical protein
MLGALVLGAGCGGSTGGASQSVPNSVTGTIGGNAIPTTSVVAVTYANVPFVVGVVFVNVADACSALQNNALPGNLTDLQLFIQSAAGLTKGTYTIGPVSNTTTVMVGGAEAGSQMTSIPLATATFGQTNASCMTTTYDTEATGTITLTTVSSSEFAGHFDVTFSSGDHLTGTFDAPVCILGSGAPLPTCGG